METTNIIITAIVGALTGLGAAFLKNKIDYSHEVRSELWNKRFEAYIRIWKLTQLIPMWPKNDKLTYQVLYEISTHFQHWYFQDGGILLSAPGHKRYGDMQETIDRILSTHDKTTMASLVSIENYNLVQSACSAFRTAITDELLSRKTVK